MIPPPGDIASVLIACRGVAAHRLVASYKRLGLSSVAAFTADDADASWVEGADFDAWIGDGPEAWTDANRLVAAAMDAGCDALHPGDGPAGRSLDVVSLATAANLAVVGIDPARAAEVLDRGRVLARARALGLAVLPAETVRANDDGIEAAARVGMPLLAGSPTVPTDVRVDDFPALADALARIGRPAFLVRAPDGARTVEVVVVAEHGGRVAALHAVRQEGPVWELDPVGSPELLPQAEQLAAALGFVGVGVVTFARMPDGSAWLAGFRPQLPEVLEVVERVHGVDLVEDLHRLTTTGATGWLGIPPAQHAGALVELRSLGQGPLDRLVLPDDAAVGAVAGDYVTADQVLARIVGLGADPAAARASVAAQLAALEVSGVPTNLDLLRTSVG